MYAVIAIAFPLSDFEIHFESHKYRFENISQNFVQFRFAEFLDHTLLNFSWWSPRRSTRWWRRSSSLKIIIVNNFTITQQHHTHTTWDFPGPLGGTGGTGGGADDMLLFNLFG